MSIVGTLSVYHHVGFLLSSIRTLLLSENTRQRIVKLFCLAPGCAWLISNKSIGRKTVPTSQQPQCSQYPIIGSAEWQTVRILEPTTGGRQNYHWLLFERGPLVVFLIVLFVSCFCEVSVLKWELHCCCSLCLQLASCCWTSSPTISLTRHWRGLDRDGVNSIR